MISADKARELTEQSALLKKVGKNIKKCAKKGMYALCMQIPASTPNYVREAIGKKLCDLGYSYDIPPRNEGCRWSFDVIDVSWGEKEEDDNEYEKYD